MTSSQTGRDATGVIDQNEMRTSAEPSVGAEKESLAATLLAKVVEAAESHFDRQDWRSAREALALGVQLAPHRADLHTAIGSMSFLLHDFPAARVAFAAAVALQPDNSESLVQLAACELKTGNSADAAVHLQNALVWRPNDPKALGYLATAYTEQSKHPEALAIYQRAFELGLEETSDVLLGMARSLVAVGDREMASQTVAKVLSADSSNAAALELARKLKGESATPPSPCSTRPIDAWGREVNVESGLVLRMGRSSYVHGNLIRNPSGARTAITIGNFTSIATGLSIVGYDHHAEWITMFPFLDDGTRDLWPGTRGIPYPQSPEFGSNKNRGDIDIGNDVWIGVDVKLFKGITIGDGAVIGAGALVNKSVPAYTIVAGVPARPIRKRFSEAEIAILNEIRWWEWPDAAVNKHMRTLCSGDIAALQNIYREGMLSPRTGGRLAMDSTVPDASADAAKYLADFPPAPDWLEGQISLEDATFLYDLVDLGVTHSVLEVGVASGWSSAILLHLLKRKPPTSGAEVWLHSFDIGEWCYFDAKRRVGSAVAEVVPGLAQHWRLHQGDSSAACCQLEGQTIDLAFIDANHMHPWATFDLLALLPLLAPDAWVALHDISLPVFTTNPEWRVYGPKYLYDSWPWEKRSVGGKRNNIGAIRVPGDHAKVRDFCKTILAMPWETNIPDEIVHKLQPS